MHARLVAIAAALSIATPSLAALAADNAPVAVRDESKKPESLRHFRLGLELVDTKEWDAALVEFQTSRALYPTYNATKNAAVCLRELHRYEEALEMYDEALARFGELDPKEHEAVDNDVATIRKHLGALTITCDQPGARVTVDGRERATTPVSQPIRVDIGTRAVRVTKDGYQPFEAQASVASAETVTMDVKLSSLAQTGTLRVTETKGAKAEVLIDGAVVGEAPWEGKLSAGTHSVALRGTGDLAAGPKAATLTVNGASELRLTLAAAPAMLRIEASPPSARLSLDGREVGVGVWSGEVASGTHMVAARADGYVSEARAIEATRDVPLLTKLDLARWRRWHAEIVTGVGGTPGHLRFTDDQGVPGDNGDVSGMLLVRGGYAVTQHLSLDLGVALTGGFAWRAYQFTTPQAQATSERLAFLTTPALLVGVAYSIFDATPLTFRVSAGLASTSFSRTVQPSGNGPTYDDQSERQLGLIVIPEVRFGVRFGAGFVLDIGGAVVVMSHAATSMPLTPSGGAVADPHAVGVNLRGGTIVIPLPTLGLHFDF